MNKSKIEWCDYSWGIVRGCLHACPYCYARRMDKRFGDGSFTPTFHPERLQEPLKVKKPSRIFVGSMADLFGDWDWRMSDRIARLDSETVILEILETTKQCPQHTFIFLTKNPKGMQGFNFPDNCWCGTSVENQEKANERIPELLKVNCKTLFVSYEPALGPLDFTGLKSQNKEMTINCLSGIHLLTGPRYGIGTNKRLAWLIIGAQTGPGATRPNPLWVNRAIDQAKAANIPLFIKDNCKWPEVIREFPQ